MARPPMPLGTFGNIRVYRVASDGYRGLTMFQAGLSARVIADQLGHSRTSMTQDTYLGRRLASDMTARVLNRSDLGGTDDAFPEG